MQVLSILFLANASHQLLLWIGVKHHEKDVRALYPVRIAPASLFWAFQWGTILFTAGGTASLFLGLRHLLHPLPLKNIHYAFIWTGIAGFIQVLVLTWNKHQEHHSNASYLHFHAQKSRVTALFMEHILLLIAVLTVLIGLLGRYWSGINFDAWSTIPVSLVMIIEALGIGAVIKSLPQRRSGADIDLLQQISLLVHQEESVRHIFYIDSLQITPDSYLLTLEVELDPRLTVPQSTHLTQALENEIRSRFPQIKKTFIDSRFVNHSNSPRF